MFGQVVMAEAKTTIASVMGILEAFTLCPLVVLLNTDNFHGTERNVLLQWLLLILAEPTLIK